MKKINRRRRRRKRRFKEKEEAGGGGKEGEGRRMKKRKKRRRRKRKRSVMNLSADKAPAKPDESAREESREVSSHLLTHSCCPPHICFRLWISMIYPHFKNWDDCGAQGMELHNQRGCGRLALLWVPPEPGFQVTNFWYPEESQPLQGCLARQTWGSSRNSPARTWPGNSPARTWPGLPPAAAVSFSPENPGL